MNDPKIIAKLLRTIAGSESARASRHDIIFTAAASLLDENALKDRALQMIRILANTSPSDWLLRSEIHAGLAEFRDASATKISDDR